MQYDEILADYKKNSSHKYCFCRDKANCTSNIKKAHSIQKEKVLSQLESVINKNKLIHSFDSIKADKDFNTIDFIPIGKKKTSIFSGFCDYHDSKIFSPIENFDFEFSDQQKFLLTYRSFAHSFHQASEIYNYYLSKAVFIRMFPKKYLEIHTRHAENNIVQLSEYKMILDNLMESNHFSSIDYHCRIIEPFVPIAVSSILRPKFSYRNKLVYNKNRGSNVILNVLPDKTRTIILISHFKQDIQGEILFSELKELTDIEFTEAISSLIIYCTENVFFSPKLWDSFSELKKRRLLAEIDFCTKRGTEINKFFKSKINFFIKE